MFTSQKLRAVVPPGKVDVREHRYDVAVHQLEIVGALSPANVGEVARRIDHALANGARWLIMDLAAATDVSDPMIAALVATARELRTRRGELIVAGASQDVAQRIGGYEVAQRPALAGSVDQAIMILKMLRPKTKIERPASRAKQRVSSLSLPRIEPRPLSHP